MGTIPMMVTAVLTAADALKFGRMILSGGVMAIPVSTILLCLALAYGALVILFSIHIVAQDHVPAGPRTGWWLLVVLTGFLGLAIYLITRPYAWDYASDRG